MEERGSRERLPLFQQPTELLGGLGRSLSGGEHDEVEVGGGELVGLGVPVAHPEPPVR